MNRRKSIICTAIIVLFLAVIISSISSLRGCSTPAASRTFFAADTVCTITIYDSADELLDGYNSNEELLDDAVELCNSLANRFNCRDESSEIGKLNKTKSCNNPSFELLEIIDYGLWYSGLGEGFFDITIKPLSTLWDFKEGVMPSEKDISAALPKIGYRNIIKKPKSITLENNAEIDLGAIAKGYIADKVTDFLVKKGVKSGIINLGGNITVIGKKDGKNFNIGIKKPFEEGNIATISCNNTSVVTSGTYQRYFEKSGKIYHHILNPKTGYPIQNELASVTIITRYASQADAYSTLCFLLGKEKGMKFIEAADNTEAVFIDKNNNIYLSSGLKQNGNLIEIK